MSIGISSSPMLRGSFNNWNDLYELVALYGVHVLAAIFLSAVTVYRREMSCNRVFHDEEEEEEEEELLSKASGTDPSFTSNSLAEETEELLEKAAMYCSGQSLMHLASRWVEAFPCDDEDGHEVIVPTQFLDEHVTPTDLLDKCGNYCSGEPIRVAVATLLALKASRDARATAAPPKPKSSPSVDPFTNSLPSDAHVHIASYLHPKDILALSCVSKTYQKVVNDGETSHAIWNTLWLRDYAWVAQNWKIGNRAYTESIASLTTGNRSSGQAFVVDKPFYFVFGETYLAYVLAGQNTMSSCLVGLHGQIYDITPFLDRHPGSPDTLMVHSGKDATRFFEDMTHSFIARRMARKFCVVSDLSQRGDSSWGLRPSTFTQLDKGCNNSQASLENDSEAGSNIMLGRKQPSQGGTLQCVRRKISKELVDLERRIEHRFGNDASILGEVNPYYDPFRREWRVWYTDRNLENKFISATTWD